MSFFQQHLQVLRATELAAALGDADLATAITPTVSTRARRVSLRVDAVNRRIILVQPRRVSRKAVLGFVASRAGWISRQLAALPARVPFADGAVIPFLGANYLVRWVPGARFGVRLEGGEIQVSGAPEHTARRLHDWLRAEARRRLSALVHVMAQELGRTVRHVSVRDTRSRWGSCGSDGRLSFSWRLVLAPEAVLVYVAAHEVAHLVHPNHSRAFWRTVELILGKRPELSGPGNWNSARQWLRRGGAALHRYG